MMVAVFQMVGLGQFIEGLVLDPPTPMPRLVNHLGGIAIQLGAGRPHPLTPSGLTAFAPAPNLLFYPLFLGADHADGFAVLLTEVQIRDFPELDVPVSVLVVKNHHGLLTLAQLLGLLIDFHVLALEHDHPQPAQLLDRPQKGTLDIPGIDRDGVKEAGTINAAHSPEQTQSRGAFLFARADRFDVQQDIDFGTVDLGEDVTVIILGDLLLVALGVDFLDLTLATALTTPAAAFEMLVGIQAYKEQAVDLRAFQSLVGFEGFGHRHQRPAQIL